jgi:predicted RNA-binding protein with PUA-like domain
MLRMPSLVARRARKIYGSRTMEMLRQSRLSVSPARDDEWDAILELAAAEPQRGRFSR